MKLRSLIEPNLFAGTRMSDRADERILELQPAVSLPFVVNQHLATVLLNGRLVSSLECLLPRQSETIAATVKVAYILDLLASEFIYYFRIKPAQDLAIIGDGSLAAFPRFDHTAEE